MEKENTEKIDIVAVYLSSENTAPVYPILSEDRKGWLKYGNDNLFPQNILKLNDESSVNNSIIESKVTYICGKGVSQSTAETGNFIGEPNPHETWDQVLEKVVRDFETFEGAALQVILNNNASSVSVFHQDYSTVRIGKRDERGKIKTYFLSDDWKKQSKKMPPVEIEAWSGRLEDMTKGKAYLYCFTTYRPGMRYYSIPSYYSAIKYIMADGLLADYYNNSINNGFTSSVVVSMPSDPGKQKKEEIQKGFEKAFTGTKGAGRPIFIYGSNGNVIPQITPYNASTNADVYNNIESIIFQKIISAHRLSSPTLAGVSGNGNLSGNASEIIDSYILFNYTVIERRRCIILDHLNKFTKINGRDPIVVEELDVVSKIKESKNNN